VKFESKKIRIIILILCVCMCLALAACNGDSGTDAEQTDAETAPLTYLVQGDGSGYRVIHNKANSNRGFAYDFMWAIKNEAKTTLEVLRDEDTEEITTELLVGPTNRQLSLDMQKEAESRFAADSHVWGFAYRDGKFAFFYNTEEAFRRGILEVKEKYLQNGALAVPEDTWVMTELTAAALAAEIEAKELEKLKKEQEELEQSLVQRLEIVKKAMAEATFTDADFGAEGDWAKKYAMPTNKFEPAAQITQAHPRVFVTKDIIPKINALLEKEEYANMASAFWSLANSPSFQYNMGTFRETVHTDGEKCRYNAETLAQIEARAMAYLLTGREVYGYEAILGIKNAMLSLLYTVEDHMDVYHGPSHTMFVLAEVYDWCYDLLTEQDKRQMISGCVYLLIEADHFTDDDFVLDKNKPSKKSTLNEYKAAYGLEFNFPPNNMNAMAGHGTGPQFLRDYMMVTVAFADEMPSWWDYVGGRFYEEYLPVTGAAYENGYVTQGTAVYAPIKLIVNLYPAYLLQTATGVNPFADTFEQCADFLLSHMLPTNKFFETGDGSRSGSGVGVGGGGYCYFYFLAALYNDTFSLQAAKTFSDNYTKFSKDSIYTLGPALAAALCAVCDEAEGSFPTDMPLSSYTPYPAGQMIARNNWSPESAVSFMKIGELTMGNHDNMDSGTFQLYYKGLLATPSGRYAHYGSMHHKYYMQNTISTNGLLVYNPNLKKSDGGWYSGSQLLTGSPSTLSEWLSGRFVKAVVTGAADEAGKYAYLAGDLTKSYHASTVDYIGRRMLTVFNEDKTMPMMFFVFDSITSDDASYKKTFLLHTVKEPTLNGADTGSFTVTPDASGRMTASVVNNGGKLVLQNVYGGDYMHKIGGEGYAFWIGNENEFDGTEKSGFNAVDSYVPEDYNQTIWGRLEVTAKGEQQTDMLNVMYVTDAGTVETVPATLVEDKDGILVGATMKDVTAMFVRTAARNAMPLTFTVSGSGEMRYYISGLYAGTWKVSVNGGAAKEMTVTEEGGFLQFSGACGTVVITPGADILPAGHAMIEYILGAASLPENAPKSYKMGEAMTLPIPSQEYAVFEGWFTDAAYTTPVTEIPASASDVFKVYAKFTVYDVYADYDYAKGSDKLTLQQDGANAKSSLTLDETNGCLVWDVVSGTNKIYKRSKPLISELEDEDNEITYIVSISKKPGTPVANAQFLLQVSESATGKNYGALNLLSTKPDGTVYLGGTKMLSTLTDDGGSQTFRLVVDFDGADGGKKALVTAYDAEGKAIDSVELGLPNDLASRELSTVLEWSKWLSTYQVWWMALGTGETTSIRVHSIYGVEGDIITAP